MDFEIKSNLADEKIGENVIKIENETIHADEKSVENAIKDPEPIKVIVPIEKFISVSKLKQSPPPKLEE